MTISYNPAIVTDGLVGLWDAGNIKSYSGTGTTWNDISGNNLTANIVGTFAYTSGPPVTFDTTIGAAWVAHNSLIAPTATISFGGWVQMDDWTSNTSQKRIISKSNTGGYTLLSNYVAGKLSAMVWTNAAWLVASYNLSSISPGWHYVMGSYDNYYIKLYIDGVAVVSANRSSSYPITYSYNNNMVIAGAAGFNGTNSVTGEYWPGKITQAQIYSNSLTDEQVQQNFNASKSRFGL